MNWPIIAGMAALIVAYAYWPELVAGVRGVIAGARSRRALRSFGRFSVETARLLLMGETVQWDDHTETKFRARRDLPLTARVGNPGRLAHPTAPGSHPSAARSTRAGNESPLLSRGEVTPQRHPRGSS